MAIHTMDNKKASELLKSSHRRDFICSECQNDADECKSSCEYGQALGLAIKALEDSGWNPIKTEKTSDDEKKELAEKYDMSLEILDDSWRYACKMPEDNQEVLITTKYGDVVLTEFCVDVDGCWFDGWEDRDDVLAWMPLPKPYTKEDTNNG